MPARTIAIGDIHGCHEEFSELLRLIDLQPDDRLVLLGDLVNRGPNTPRVLELARAHRAISLLGNHELRLLNYRRTRDLKFVKENDLETFDQLTAEDWTYLENMLLTYEDPDLNLVCVHGGFLPDIPWNKQPAEIVTRIQVIDAAGQPCKRADAPAAPSWADLWNGPPFVVYGHTPRPEIYKRKWSVGIDTACAMGGHLTAFILPEKRFVQVKARRPYFS